MRSGNQLDVIHARVAKQQNQARDHDARRSRDSLFFWLILLDALRFSFLEAAQLKPALVNIYVAKIYY